MCTCHALSLSPYRRTHCTFTDLHSQALKMQQCQGLLHTLHGNWYTCRYCTSTYASKIGGCKLVHHVEQLLNHKVNTDAQTTYVRHLRFSMWKCLYPKPPVILRVLFIWSPEDRGTDSYCCLPCKVRTHIVNMSANQQLWKASKRGDIAVVRQAVSGGADI